MSLCPTLILAVFDDDAPQFTVPVAYGTSQRTTTLYRGEFAIPRDRNPAAFAAAGLRYDTKFDLKHPRSSLHNRLVLGPEHPALGADESRSPDCHCTAQATEFKRREVSTVLTPAGRTAQYTHKLYVKSISYWYRNDFCLNPKKGAYT